MVKIDTSWNSILHLDIFDKIIDTIKDSVPPKSKLLIPFSYFKLNQLKIVILAEEPYPNPELSTGLAFSVDKSVIKIPQSINNMFKEINQEYNYKYNFEHGDLTKWASREKILLLNSSFTTIKDKTKINVHHKIWEQYTDIIIQEISNNTKNVCFVLFGKNSQKKKILIDTSKHFIVESIHPSPQIAHSGFFNTNIFKKIEIYVGKIDWQN